MVFTDKVSQRLFAAGLLGASAIGMAFLLGRPSFAETAVVIPPPTATETVSAHSEKVVLAGGCFWGVQAVFQHVKGVKDAVSGYAGGQRNTASYPQVSTGQTGHAESVEVTFDPQVVSYGTLLQIYFSVAHNPTELNRQGPDAGTQYRSEIFYENDEQKRVAESYIAQLDAAKAFGKPIVTRVEALQGFYPAEAHHQNYATLNPDSAYIAYNDAPKVDNLGRFFPGLFRDQPKLVAVAGVN
jgi:peptide-methionine (S)-S-oxide reductase